MGLAVLAAVDALGVEVDVVGQAHLGRRSGLAYYVQAEGVRALRWLAACRSVCGEFGRFRVQEKLPQRSIYALGRHCWKI